MRRVFTWAVVAGMFWCSAAAAQTRDEQVRKDRQTLSGDESWVYNNLDEGIEIARRDQKPLLIVLRCIP